MSEAAATAASAATGVAAAAHLSAAAAAAAESAVVRPSMLHDLAAWAAQAPMLTQTQTPLPTQTPTPSADASVVSSPEVVPPPPQVATAVIAQPARAFDATPPDAQQAAGALETSYSASCSEEGRRQPPGQLWPAEEAQPEETAQACGGGKPQMQAHAKTQAHGQQRPASERGTLTHARGGGPTKLHRQAVLQQAAMRFRYEKPQGKVGGGGGLPSRAASAPRARLPVGPNASHACTPSPALASLPPRRAAEAPVALTRRSEAPPPPAAAASAAGSGAGAGAMPAAPASLPTSTAAARAPLGPARSVTTNPPVVSALDVAAAAAARQVVKATVVKATKGQSKQHHSMGAGQRSRPTQGDAIVAPPATPGVASPSRHTYTESSTVIYSAPPSSPFEPVSGAAHSVPVAAPTVSPMDAAAQSDEKIQKLISTCSYWASVLQATQPTA